MVGLKVDFPESFFEGETRNDYYVSPEMKKVWAVELDLLSELLRVCKKYDLKIFAAGGTMLGAVRHKGFIPWDDDIDMVMFREDYEKLCEVAETEFQQPYFWQTEYSDPGNLREHAKLRNSNTTGISKWQINFNCAFNQGIFIDIFPYDNVIDNEKKLKKQLNKIRKYKWYCNKCKGLSYFYINSDASLKRTVKRILHCLFEKQCRILARKLYVKTEKEAQLYNNLETSRIAPIAFYPNAVLRYRQDFDKVIYMAFENMSIPVPAGYDRLLRMQYGNYMEFVKGKNLHGEIVFETDISYVEYLDNMQTNGRYNN